MNLLTVIIKRISRYFAKRQKEKNDQQIDSQRRNLFNKNNQKNNFFSFIDSWKNPFKIGSKIKFKLESKIEDEKLKVQINLKHFTAKEIQEILNAFKNDIELKKLVSGKKIDLSKIDFEDFKKQLSQYNQNLDKVKLNHFEIPHSKMFHLNNLANSPWIIQDFIKKFDQHRPIAKINMKIYNWMRSYQREGYLWMKKLLKFNFGCLLADDMGLGKTVQTVAVIIDILVEKPNAKILIVCPVSLVYNWEKEIKQHLPNATIAIVSGDKNSRKKKLQKNLNSIFITPTSSAWRDVFFYQDLSLDLLILDEAQSIKNPNTNTAKGLMSIKADKRIALTGTPIENHLGELWSIMNFLNPGILGEKKFFFENYEKPIYAGQKEKKQILQQIIKTFILRRTKENVLSELPKKITSIITIDFSDSEKNIYNRIIIDLKKAMENELSDNRKYAYIFKMITLLRQACCDTRLISQEGTNYPSAKLNFLMDKIKLIIQENNKNKILIFSQFTSMLNLIELEFKKNNIKYHLLTGKDKIQERLKKVENFNQDDSKVFLISLKAGGTGLNITSANYVFHYDPWWNLAAENQATDRAHRMGQKRVVFVNKLIIKNTLEEKIIAIQDRKFELFKTFIENQGANIKMDLNSLKEIIGIN